MATPNKTIDNERVIDALVGQESGGRYDAINESYDKRRKKKVYAVGKYQIMDYNLPEWTLKHLGRQLSVQEFLASPEAQDRVGRGQINEYYTTNLSRYNDPAVAAQETALDWYGRGTPSEGPSGRDYVSQVMGRLGSNYNRIASQPDSVALSSALEEAKKKAPYGVVFVAGGKIRDYTGAEIGDVPTLGKVQADTSNEHEEAKKAVEALRSGGSAPITPSELNLDDLAKYSPTGLKGGLTNLTPQLREVAKANLGLTFDASAIKNELPPKPGVYELGDDLQPVDKFDAKANADRQAIRDSRKRLLKENANMLEPGDVVESKGELVDRVAPYEEQQKTYELQAKNSENIIDKGLFSLAASGGVGAGIAEGVVAAAEALPLVSQAMNSSDGFFGLTDDAAKEKALIWGKDWNRLDDTEKNRFRMLAKIDDQNALSSIRAPGKISTPFGDVGVSDAIRTTSGLASYLPVLGAGARTFAALGKNALPAAVIAAEFPDKAIEVAKGDKNIFEAVTELGIDAAGMRAIAPIMEKAIKVGEGAKTALGGQIKGGLTNIAGQTAVGLGQQAATALVQGRGNLSGEELGQNALTNIGLSLLDVRGGIKRARLQKDLEGYIRTTKPDVKTVGDDTYTKVDEVDGKVVVDVAKKDGTVERKEMPKKEWVLADTPHSFTSGKYVTDIPTVDHVISRGENKGKIVKGVLATDITGEQARAIDPYAFKKDNGYFIRLSHVERPEGYVAPDADIPTIGKLRKDFPGIQAAYSDLNGKPHMVVSKDMLAGLDGRDKVKAERALRKSGFEKIGNMFVYEYGDTLPSDFAPKQAPAEPKRIFDGYEFGIRQEGDKFIVEEGKNDIASFDDVDAAKGYVSKFEKIPEAKVDNSTSKEPTLVDNVVTKPEVLVDNVEPGNHGERLTKEFQEGMGYDQEKAASTVALLDAHASMLEGRGLIKKDEYLSRFKVTKGGTPGEGALYQGENAPAFYSALDKFVEGIPQEKLSVEQLKGQLAKTPGIKAEEVNWRGLDTFLEGKKSVTKQELVDYLANNEVDIQTDNGAQFKDEATGDVYYTAGKYEQYTVPGGENYQEHVFTLKGSGYNSSHFAEIDDYLAHARTTDRTIDGKKTLFVEEIQSDLHQKGREQGYRGDYDALREEVLRSAIDNGFDYGANYRQVIKEAFDRIVTSEDKTADALSDDWQLLSKVTQDKVDLNRIHDINDRGVPDAPFKKTWHELAMKKLIDKAVREGYDQVAWTSGDVQNERYDLSKQIDNIYYKKNADDTFNIGYFKDGRGQNISEALPADKLADYVGKEVARKVIDGEGNEENFAGNNQRPNLHKVLSGVDLKIGGSGMKGFYDKMLPDFANKYLKKYGVKVGEVEGTTATHGDIERYKREIDQAINQKGNAEFKSLSLVEDLQNRIPEGHEDHWLNAEEKFAKYGTPKEFADYQFYNVEYEVAKEQIKRLRFEQQELKAGAKVGGSHLIPITSEMRSDITAKGQPLFQGKKGSIEFAAGERLIRGLEAPDASTGVHELSHAFLEDLIEFAPKDKQFASDLQTVKNWTGAKENIETVHHEQFARGFENYLREGKSPSAELHGVFQRFARWLRDIYAKIKGSEIDIPISKEMNKVFDRLFVNKIINERVGNERLVVNPKDLQTHPDFQNRKEAFSKDTYDKIMAEGWNWDKYVPIKVWQDPKTNEYFTLNHTRRQAALDLGIDKLPVEVIEAKTFAEAKDLARDSNNLGTPETPLERSGRYRDLWGSESNTSIDKKAKQNEGSNKELVLALSRLDPQSKALQDLQVVDKSSDRDSYNQIEKFAKWTGKLQGYFGEFSRKQQNEVYEYLRDNKDVKSFDVLRDYVQRAYDKAYFEGFDASKPLNLKQAKDIHPEELRFNEKLNIAKSEYELAKKEFESKKELAIAQGIAIDSHPAILESKERLRATENVYRDLLRNKADILAKIRGEEQNLFGERADSRVPGGKGGERIKDFKVRLVDAVEKGEYNKQEFAAGDEVYRYSAESKGNEMPTEGIIKNLANMPVFFDPKTKRMSLIDENVVRVGTPHPLTQKNGRAVPYIISQMANNLAKSLDVTNGYGLFTSKRRFGYFKGDTKNNSSYIGINRDIFVDPNQVSQTLGHEIGHFLDWASRTFNKKTLREKVIPENQVKMFDKMLENYGKIANDLPELDGVLQKELENLSKEWSPDDNPDVDYRYSPKELYAEYISALLNEDFPLIERVAPNFHKAFLNKLNERPEVRAAYESLKNDLNPDNPKVWEAKLDADIKKNADSRERMREIMEEDEKATKKAVKKPMQHFDYYYPVEAALREKEAAYYDVLKKAGVTEKERGAYIEAKRNIKNGVDVEANQEKITKQAKKLGADKMAALQEASKILGDNLYWSELRESIMDLRLSSESQAEIVDEVDGMLKDIRDLDLEWTIPVYLENTAIIGKHREGKGNPGFSDPFAAQKTLDAMKERIGEDNYIAVEKAGEAFHGTQLDELRLFGEDMITQEALQSLEDHADSYARFQSMVDDKLMPYYSRSGVKGMLDQTRDVLVTGTLQKMTMRHARLLNDAKKTVVELHDGKEAKVVNKNANGKKRYAPPRPGFDIIEVREKGELKGYVVDQYIADIFAKANNSNMWEWYTHWMNIQRTNLITLNAGWWMNNPIRDTFRNVKNVGFGVLAETPKAFKAAIDMQRGVPNALVDEATKAGALNHRMRSGWIDGAQPVEKVLRSKDEKVSLLQKASNFVMKPLEVVEAVNRLSAHSYLRKKGMSPKEAAFHSRQFASTPDSSVSGYSTAKMNRILMFSKMTVNGIMSDARVMRNPSTRKGVIARAMITTVIPKVMTGLAAYGVLGDIAEEVFGEDSEITETLKAVGDLYAAIPEYDLLRFTCIPIGLSKNEDGKLMIEYVRLADDPNYTAVANMILGLVGKVAQGEPDEAISDVVEQFYQAMPGAAPVIDAGLAWSDYLLGSGDPTDKFRKQSVLTTNESNSVKGAPIGEKIASDAGKEMGLWTLQKIMGANYSLFVAPHVSPRHDPSFRFGVYANNPAYSSERREVEGEARRDAAGMSLEASKIIDSKDTQEIENAYRSGLLTEKQYRRGMKEAGMSDEETNLRDKPTKILLKLQAHAKHRGLNTDYELITKVLESRKKKSTFKGVGGNSGKSALLGK